MFGYFAERASLTRYDANEQFEDLTSSSAAKPSGGTVAAGTERFSKRSLRAKASILTTQSSPQLNAEFRATEYDTSAEKDEFHRIRMQMFAIQSEETIEAQRHLYIQEGGEEKSEEMKTHQVPWSICLESQSQNRYLELPT